MEKESNVPTLDESRRKFLQKAGKVSVAAPAAAILLSGGIPTEAEAAYDNSGDPSCPSGQVLITLPDGTQFCDFPSQP